MSDLERSLDVWIQAEPGARREFLEKKIERIDEQIEVLKTQRAELQGLLGRSKKAKTSAPSEKKAKKASKSDVDIEAVYDTIAETAEEGASRSDVQESLDISDGQWTKAVKELGKRLKVKGIRRGARYFAAGK